MATERNITMKQFNGIDYDTLYPKTIASQVDGVYNKEESISDATKTLYGLPSTAVPDDAFKKMPSKVNETSDTINPVGTIQTTVRTDLGSNWLLCDGSSFDPAEYPDLANVLSTETSTDKNLINNIQAQKILHIDNLWVVVSAGGAGTLYVSYTTDPTGTWTNKQIASSNAYYNEFRYVNGYYVIIVHTATDYPYVTSIYYTQDVSGTWNKQDMFNGSTRVCDIIYFKNEYCLITEGSGTDMFYCYHTSSLGGTWAQIAIPRDTSKFTTNLSSYITVATDGNVLGVLGSLYTQTNDNLVFCSATNITGTWSSQSVSTSGYAQPCLIYGNGYFVCFGATTSNSYLWIKYKTVNATAFSDATVDSLSYGYNGADGIYYNNYFYILCKNSNFYGSVVANDPSGPWSRGTGLAMSTSPELQSLAKSDNYMVFAGYLNSIGKAFVFQTAYLLPTITADKSYVYIKAKKDSET